jgi:hypothetical protein
VDEHLRETNSRLVSDLNGPSLPRRIEWSYLFRASTPRTSSVRSGILTTLNSSYSSSI